MENGLKWVRVLRVDPSTSKLCLPFSHKFNTFNEKTQKPREEQDCQKKAGKIKEVYIASAPGVPGL